MVDTTTHFIIGIMQGRLSPKLPTRLQSFPWDSWQEEFHRASHFGFQEIEWLYDLERRQENPLLTREVFREYLSRDETRQHYNCYNTKLAPPWMGAILPRSYPHHTLYRSIST